MQVHFLGTGGYHPNDVRQTCCVMLPDWGILLDAGTGLFRARPRLRTESLHIFLSHAHLDHCIGLTYLLDVLDASPVRELFIYGESDKLGAIQQHLLSTLLFPIVPNAHWTPLSEPEFPLPGGGQLTWFPLEHPGGSVGFRLDWPGRSMAYITDTTADEGAPYVAQIAGVDLLIHECNFHDGEEAAAKETGHSSLTPVLAVARKAGAGRLVLFHLNALDDAVDPFRRPLARGNSADVSTAFDGMEIEL